MADNLTLPANQILTDLINRSNAATSLALTPALVTYGVPQESLGGRNTELTVGAAVGSGYKGQADVTYNRLNLQSDIADVAGLTLTFPVGDATNASDFLDEINAALGLGIVLDDIVDAALPPFSGALNEEIDVDLVAAAGSYIYIGTLAFSITSNEVDLADVIEVTELDGLTYEAPNQG